MAEAERLICESADLLDGGKGVRFQVGYFGRQEPAFVIRFRGRVYGYLNRCGHVPIEMDWQEGQFFDFTGLYLICATHGALYAPEDGSCQGGRCNGKGLVSLSVLERDGHVYLVEKES
ncbi:MAG TPA: Rieske 2Fe-2S domain-containing protein [Rhodocyclaceae bacterium]|nr:Rieske 2Fe-2S domain-containing protein [Rhodocyclaceae bacterium]